MKTNRGKPEVTRWTSESRPGNDCYSLLLKIAIEFVDLYET